MNQDPLELTGGTNSYTYPANPIAAIDPLGLWSTSAHNKILDAYGQRKGLSSEQIQALKDGSKAADAYKYQGPNHSHKHGMSSKTQKAKMAILN